MFGCKKAKRIAQLEAANAALAEQLRRIGAVEYAQLQGEIHRMRGELGQLRELHAVKRRERGGK
ncbi:hypothetical protein NLX83_03535 [Allokutzneria sp. A3M-2-11 16]|uniref:hypothetical protein n=1 Tax=Allokutzneria sp. A3M-2-11 16 TaxID=2962043 RepID=UPI0020B6CB0E|nr:hypothetical protein [Allokutzneria sp. A3M-2-11 16]MCP3798323.1 hypothetical protein [Allokutzneria sp. A3M-2-11 16]